MKVVKQTLNNLQIIEEPQTTIEMMEITINIMSKTRMTLPRTELGIGLVETKNRETKIQ